MDIKQKPIFVYALELAGGNYYIGQTKNIKRRTRQHASNTRTGSLWTAKHQPIGFVEIDSPAFYSESEAAHRESEITLQYMKKYGWRKVRGGAFCCLDESELLYQLQMAGHFRDVPILDRIDKTTGEALPTFRRYYAVARGRRIGIFTAWDGIAGAASAINGFPGAIYKKFKLLEEAERWLNANNLYPSEAPNT